MNLLEVFYQQVEKQPEHPLIFGPEDENVYSYKDFSQVIQILIEEIKTIGIKSGSCIGLHYPNGYQYISLTYALWGCGAIVVPIPVELTIAEKQQIFENIRIDAVISKTGIASDFKALQTSTSIPFSENTVLIPVKQLRDQPTGLENLNAAFVRFTSGTTGTAKGVVLSHETIYERIVAANKGLQIGSNDSIIWLLSMAYHFTVSIVAYLSFGATIVFCKNHFGSTIINTAARHKATIIYGAPTHYELMTHDQGSELLPDLRLAITTTTSLRKEVGTAFYKRFKKPLNETYGIIEVGLPCMNIEKPLEKNGSVGCLLPDYEMQLEKIGVESGLRLIKLRGVGTVDAYYEPWKTREEILQGNNGWFSTGDLGYVDDEGYLYIRGRSKEMISVGGMKFFPQEVELVLESHPAIQEACVFGYRDKRLGEIPYTQLVKASEYDSIPNEDELKDFCASCLAIYKVPKRFEFVDSLTRTASGKLIRDASKLLK